MHHRRSLSHPSTSAPPARPSFVNQLGESPYGAFYGDTQERVQAPFVFVTRDGRIKTRLSDGTLSDVTRAYWKAHAFS